MKEEMFLSLHEIVKNAKMLGLTVLLENRINLIKYDKKGKIKSLDLFDYDEKNIQKIQNYLNKIEQRKHGKWEPEFRRIIPALETLNWRFESCYAQAAIIDSVGYITYYPYSKEGVTNLSEEISNRLLSMHAKKITSSKLLPADAEKPTRKESVTDLPTADDNEPCSQKCQECNNRNCQRDPLLVAVLWYNLDEESRQKLMNSLPPERQEELRQCLQ